MNAGTARLTGVVIMAAVCLGATGAAAYYRHRSVALRAETAQARDEIEILRHELLLKQPRAGDVVLNMASPAESESDGARLAFDDDGRENGTGAERIRELELALQAKERQLATLQERATNRPAVFRGPGSDWNSRMAELQRTDPERYQEMVARREAARQEMRDAFARQAAHLLEDQATGTTDDELAQRQAMLKLVADTWQMAEQLYSGQPVSNRWDMVHTMRQNVETLTPMLDAERNRAFTQLALESGYSGADTAVFVDYLNQVIEATSTGPLNRAIRRSAHGGGWRGGPPPAGNPGASGGASAAR